MSWRHDATAPSWMLKRSSGTNVLSSTCRTIPVPEHVGHAPPPLNASSSAQRPLERHVHRRRHIVAVRTRMARQTREHQTKRVEQLGRRPERRMHSRNAGTLPQRDRGRNVPHIIDLRTSRLRNATARVGRKGVEIPARPFGIQHPERQRAFARPRHAGDAYQLAERYIDVDILQVVHACAAHFDAVRGAEAPAALVHVSRLPFARISHRHPSTRNACAPYRKTTRRRPRGTARKKPLQYSRRKEGAS